ncbi:MAG: pyridoxal-phosphate dependent enzyme [Sandaracinaceae bacterium]|nr:pyridoxal-phosphate dependent enzyme [Sandaracinaceae bacterium]
MCPWSISDDELSRARAVVAAHAARTPVVAAPALGPGVHLKLECAQITGSFKLRGALAALAALDPATRARGVVTASAGNHGYGLARAGAAFGVPVSVVVGASTPAVKREGIAAAGATLEVVDARGYDAVEAHAKELARARGLAFVSPFDDPAVAAGNGGTVGLEVLEDLPSVRTLVAPVGGGGLIAGLAAARRVAGASFALVGVQSEACPAMARSLEEGRARLTFEGAPTLAEGLEGGVSEATFLHARASLGRMDLVSEAAIRDAMRFAHDALGLVIEGSAAVAVAWIRAHRVEVEPPVVAIVTGANVDPAVLSEILR